MTVQTRLSGTDYPLKLSSQEFLALADAGLFDRYGRTELIEGEIWTLNAVHRWHSRAHIELAFAIREALRAADLDLVIYGPGSILLSDDSVPEPDISIAAEEPLTREPISLAAVRIAIELTDTTRAMDLGRKAALYARHGIPEYWVADRGTRTLVRHAAPGRRLSVACSRARNWRTFYSPFPSSKKGVPTTVPRSRPKAAQNETLAAVTLRS